ncbi:MAG: hypothetical protein HWD61_15660 [Parachlamydiaceae bacterium]|nr:MAG: hypothetical protein HWD61_15660 [Parachlamydiaceae bacterium]
MLGTRILEDYVIPLGSQLNTQQILALKDKLDPQKFRQLMENGWNQLMERSAYFQNEIPYAYF